MTAEASKLWNRRTHTIKIGRSRPERDKEGASQHGELEIEPFQCALQDWLAAIPQVKQGNNFKDEFAIRD